LIHDRRLPLAKGGRPMQSTDLEEIKAALWEQAYHPCRPNTNIGAMKGKIVIYSWSLFARGEKSGKRCICLDAEGVGYATSALLCYLLSGR
jgi:hypothetical protein